MAAALPSSDGLQVPFGQNVADGRMYAPLEVPRGKHCGCVCPECGEQLIAKHCLSGKVIPHFAHAVRAECIGGFMTALHKAAVQMIMDRKCLYLPTMTVEARGEDRNGGWHSRCVNVFEGETSALVNPMEEVWIPLDGGAPDGVRPDIVAQMDGGQIAIEIAVTHYVGDPKLQKLRRLDLATVEVDLSDLDRVDFSILEAILLNENARISWKFHPREAEAKRKASEELSAAIYEANRQIEQSLKEAAERRRAMRTGASLSDLSQEFIDRFATDRRPEGGVATRMLATNSVERARRARFRMLAESEKLEALTKALGVSIDSVETRGAGSFGVQNDLIWQLALYGWIEKKRARYGSIIQIDDCLLYLGECFEISESSKSDNIEAVYDYLMGLADRGYLHYPTRSIFYIRYDETPSA